MPQFAAERTLLAPLEDVWAFLAEPYHLADWFPGIAGVQPDRRGLAPGARWQVLGPNRPSWFKKPDASGTLLVLDVVPMRRVAFQLTGQKLDAHIELEQRDQDRTKVSLVVDAPFLTIRRSFPHLALSQLYDLVQTAADSS